MLNLLYLVHRLPYPPNKGDKVRSYHLLRHLAKRYRVYLGTFIDDPEDDRHLDAVKSLCADVHVARLNPRTAKLASLGGLLRGEPLTVGYYRDGGLERWVDQVQRSQQIAATLVFSSSMAQYAPSNRPMLVDFVDVDSAKWTAYAPHHHWPLSWVYRREGMRLLEFERAVAQRSARSFFVTEREADLFRHAAPEAAGSIDHFGNGVDTDFYCPDANCPSPFLDDELPLVFTGAMDYWPNVDAVTWFARTAMPALRARWPRLRLHIVGRSPARAVTALAGPGIAVTGTVPDVRPYLQHAAVIVAPLRLARGIQNKVLEAMAMARPVVAARECVEALGVGDGVVHGVMPADEPADYVRSISELLQSTGATAGLGASARRCVLERFAWAAQFERLDRFLPVSSQTGATL